MHSAFFKRQGRAIRFAAMNKLVGALCVQFFRGPAQKPLRLGIHERDFPFLVEHINAFSQMRGDVP